MSNYTCIVCDFHTQHKSVYERHVNLKRHIERVNPPVCINPKYKCKCGKVYQTHSGNWKHSKICLIANAPQPEQPEQISPNELLLKMQEMLKETMITFVQNLPHEPITPELIQAQIGKIENIINNGQINVNNNNNNNNINFNANMYLTENCNSAPNMIDFIKSIRLNLEDVKDIHKVKYAECVSTIMKNYLEKLSFFNRPIHIIKEDNNDTIIHIKQSDKWFTESKTQSPFLYSAVEQIGETPFNSIIGMTPKMTVERFEREDTTVIEQATCKFIEKTVIPIDEFIESKNKAEAKARAQSNLIIEEEDNESRDGEIEYCG